MFFVMCLEESRRGGELLQQNCTQALLEQFWVRKELLQGIAFYFKPLVLYYCLKATC